MNKSELCLLNIAGRLDEPVDACLPLFAPERREAILRYRFNSDRNRTVWAELMARSVAARRAGRNTADVEILRDAEGRPSCSVPGVFISLSHSGPWVACCAGETACGADVEVGHSARLDIAKRFFLPGEYLCLKSAADSGEDWRTIFLRYWTIKESCLKCLGLREWSNVDCEALINGDGPVGARTFTMPDGAVAAACAAHNALPDGVTFMYIEELRAVFGVE